MIRQLDTVCKSFMSHKPGRWMYVKIGSHFVPLEGKF